MAGFGAWQVGVCVLFIVGLGAGRSTTGCIYVVDWLCVFAPCMLLLDGLVCVYSADLDDDPFYTPLKPAI